MSLAATLASVRRSACAILRIRPEENGRHGQDEGHGQEEGEGKEGRGGREDPDGRKESEARFQLAFVGSGYCIVDDTLVLTAHHVLNRGEERRESDRFVVFTVPDNEERAFHAPVAAFPLEEGGLDLAVLELGTPGDEEFSLRGGPVAVGGLEDGTRVLTYGFPAPRISAARLDPDGGFLGGGRFFLKGHANEGILSAQYDLSGRRYYEFNVGWHHGESGGPVAVAGSRGAIALMQHYRNIESPHGTVAGPRRGIALEAVAQELDRLGGQIV